MFFTTFTYIFGNNIIVYALFLKKHSIVVRDLKCKQKYHYIFILVCYMVRYVSEKETIYFFWIIFL